MPITVRYLKLCHWIIWGVALFVACEALPSETPSLDQSTTIATVSLPTMAPTWVAPPPCNTIDNRGLPDEALRGSHILYQGINDDAHYKQIWVVSMQDGTRQLLVEKYPVAHSDLAFLQDGYHFVWVDDSGQIWMSDLDGTPPIQYDSTTDFLMDFIPYSPKWNMLADREQFPEVGDYWQGRLHSPDGKKIAIWEDDDPTREVQLSLVISDTTNGQAVRVMEGPPQSYSEGNWSPDGKLLAFSQTIAPLEPIEQRHGQVYVVESDGSNLRSVTQHFESADLGRPLWSPDGQKLAFLIWEYAYWPNPSIGVATLATGDVDLWMRDVLVGPSIMSYSNLIWSPDSQWIAFFTLWERDIRVFNVDSGDMFCITQDGNAIVENIMEWR